jgi:hypothetical protein
LVDGIHDFGIDFAGEDLIDDLDGRGIGDALALDEGGFEAGFFHGAGDGFAAAMDDDGIDFDGLEEDEVTGDALADGGVGRIHETAAVFDDESGAAELLDIGKRFEECLGFGDQILHDG